MLKNVQRLRELRGSYRKTTTPGARVLGSLLPSRGGIGWPGGWSSDRLEQVMHFRNWNYVTIHTICSKIAQTFPNIAYVRHHKIPGVTTKHGESIRDFGGTTHAAVSGTLTPTVGFMYRKSLSSVKAHEELEPVEYNHPLRRLLENPNPMDTCYDLMYELQLFIELCGVSYLWVVPNTYGVPCELWVLPAHWVWPVTGKGEAFWTPQTPDTDNLIAGYQIRPWNGMGVSGIMTIPAEDMIVFSNKNPLNKLDGWSPQAAGAMWIDTEESIVKSRWAQMCNQARSDVHIELPADVIDPDDNRIARIEAKFMAKYQGELNYGKPIFTPGGTKVTPLSFSPQEMAYFQCLDEETECLTAEGWKKYDELTLETRVACYDKKSNTILYRTPSAVTINPYQGKMYRWKGDRVDALMSPNHRVYVNRPTSKMVGGEIVKKRTPYRDSSRMSKVRIGATIINEKVWDILRVEDLARTPSYGILAAAPAACDTPTAIAVEKFSGWRQRDQLEDLNIAPEVWLRFLGYYISEGSASCRKVGNGTNGWEVSTCQKKYVKEFRECLASTPFSWKESLYANGVYHWNTTDKGLYNHILRHCGGNSFDKKIPDYVKAWPAEYLRILLDALILGDGSKPVQHLKGRGGNTRGKARKPRQDQASWSSQYYTSSKQLADDVQEIAVKCGLFTSLSVKLDKRPEYLGRERFTVNISSRAEIEVSPSHRSQMDYDGKIWCVTVPTGLFVVRRNGKVHITGNSEEQMRDMVMALRQFPKTAAGISNDMTFGSVLATAASFCSNSINPRLAPLGQRLTKELAPRFATEADPVKLWWDDCSPADPQQVNSDISQDLQAYAITPNEVRALRGRPPYKHGGDDPLVSGPGGMIPLPLNTGEDQGELSDLVPVYPKDDPGEGNAPDFGDDGGDDDGGGDYGGMPDLTTPSIAAPNGAPSKGYRMTHAEWIENIGVSKAAKSREFSSTQFDLNRFPKVSNVLRKLQERIDPADLTGDGLETDLHVTVKYGLKTEDIQQVRSLVEGFGPVRIKLGKVSLFQSEEQDVVKVEVGGPDIHRLNSLLARLPHKDTYPVYSPHVTLGYVLPGEGEKYVGEGTGAWATLTLDSLTFSDKEGYKTTIPLANGVKAVTKVPSISFRKESAGKTTWEEKGVIGDTVQSAGRWLANKWENLEARYGRKAALAMAVASIATFPIPGNITAVIGVAEAIRGISGWFQRDFPAGEEKDKILRGWDSMEDGGVTEPDEIEAGEVVDKSLWFEGRQVDVNNPSARSDVERYLREEKREIEDIIGKVRSFRGSDDEFSKWWRRLPGHQDARYLTQSQALEHLNWKLRDLLSSELAVAIGFKDKSFKGEVVDKCGGEGSGVPGPCPDEGSGEGGSGESGKKTRPLMPGERMADNVPDDMKGKPHFTGNIDNPYSFVSSEGIEVNRTHDRFLSHVNGELTRQWKEGLINLRDTIENELSDVDPDEDVPEETVEAVQDAIKQNVDTFIRRLSILEKLSLQKLEKFGDDFTPEERQEITDKFKEAKEAVQAGFKDMSEDIHRVDSDDFDSYFDTVYEDMDKAHDLPMEVEDKWNEIDNRINAQLEQWKTDVSDYMEEFNDEDFETYEDAEDYASRLNETIASNHPGNPYRIGVEGDEWTFVDVEDDWPGKPAEEPKKSKSVSKSNRPLKRYLLDSFLKSGKKSKTVDKCGGEGGTPGPCPDEGGGESKPSKPAGKRPIKGPHVDAAKEVLDKVRAGGVSLDELDAYTATLRKLPESKLRAVAEAVGVPSGVSAGDLRSEIGDKLNQIRGAANRAARGKPTTTESKPAEEKPTQPKPTSPEKVRADASTLLSGFDKLDTGRNWVSLLDLRRQHPDIPKEEFDAAINHLRREGVLTAGALEGREGATREELDAAIRGSDKEVFGYLSRRNPKKGKTTRKSPARRKGTGKR